MSNNSGVGLGFGIVRSGGGGRKSSNRPSVDNEAIQNFSHLVACADTLVP
jgi:hypothetical protein